MFTSLFVVSLVLAQVQPDTMFQAPPQGWGDTWAYTPQLSQRTKIRLFITDVRGQENQVAVYYLTQNQLPSWYKNLEKWSRKQKLPSHKWRGTDVIFLSPERAEVLNRINEERKELERQQRLKKLL